MHRPSASIALLTLACLLLPPPPPARAEGDPYTAAFKFVGEAFAKQFGSFVYRTQCKGQEPKGAGGAICGAIGSFTGDSEREWKENIDRQLKDLATGLAVVQAGIVQIRADQERMLQQNAQILIRLDEIIGETVAAPALSRIRALWTEQYAPMIKGERTFDRARTVAFAQQVIKKDRVDVLLGQINDVLVNGQIGAKPPLLRLYAQRMATKMGDVRRADLDLPYGFLELVMTELQTEQRKGAIMYLWAASILQAECEVNKNCTTLPHTAVEYEKVVWDHLDAQFAEFNLAIEWLVLAGSDPTSRDANYLHRDAERIFAAADLLTAANLGKGFGLRGRVISLGEAFDGKLSIGANYTPVRAASLIASPLGKVDWWKASGNPPVWTEVNFSDQWKVYPYHVAKAPPGTYSISTALPWKSKEIKVVQIDLANGRPATSQTPADRAVPFGSFVATARAGGGYALMSGDWEVDRGRTTRSVSHIGDLEGDLAQVNADPVAPPAGPKVWLNTSGRIKWTFGETGNDQHVEGWTRGVVVRRQQVTYPAGGQVTLNVVLGDVYDALCPDHRCINADIHSSNTVIRLWTDFSKSKGNDRSAKLFTKAGVEFGADTDNGVFWESNLYTDSERDTEVIHDGRAKSSKVTLAAGKPTQLAGRVYAELNVQTSGLDSTRFWMLSVLRPVNMYLTP